MRVTVEHSGLWSIVSLTRGNCTVQVKGLPRHAKELFNDEPKTHSFVVCFEIVHVKLHLAAAKLRRKTIGLCLILILSFLIILFQSRLLCQKYRQGS